jgi:hypothetical protein
MDFISKQFDINTLCDPIFYFYKPTRLIMEKRAYLANSGVDCWPCYNKRVYQCKLKTCPMPAPTPVQTVQLSWSSLGAIDDGGMCVSSSFYWNNGRIDQTLPLKDCFSNCPWHWKTLQKFALRGKSERPSSWNPPSRYTEISLGSKNWDSR